jgi:hypothetical protein
MLMLTDCAPGEVHLTGVAIAKAFVSGHSVILAALLQSSTSAVGRISLKDPQFSVIGSIAEVRQSYFQGPYIPMQRTAERGHGIGS